MSSASPKKPFKPPTEAEIKEALRILNEANTNLTEKEKVFDEAKKKFKEKNDIFKPLETALETVQEAFNNHQSTKTSADDLVDEIKEKIKKLEGELSSLSDPDKIVRQKEIDGEKAKLIIAETKKKEAKTKNDDLQSKLTTAKTNLKIPKKEKETAEKELQKSESERDAAQKEQRKASDKFFTIQGKIIIPVIDPFAPKPPKDLKKDIIQKLIKIKDETINDINKINNQTVKVPSLYVLENGAHSNSDIDAFISAITSNSIQNPIKNGNIYYLPESLYNELVKKMPNFKPTLKYIKPNNPSQYLKNITYQDILEAYQGNAQDITDPNKLTT